MIDAGRLGGWEAGMPVGDGLRGLGMMDAGELGSWGAGAPAGGGLRGRGTALRNAGGFTLVEVLIGVVIMTTMALAAYMMFPLGYQTVDIGGKKTMAVQAARQVVEDLRTMVNQPVQAGQPTGYQGLIDIQGLPASTFDSGDCRNTPNAATNIGAWTPANNLALNPLRRFAWALRGDANRAPWTAVPWTLSATERAVWATLSADNAPFCARGTVQVTARLDLDPGNTISQVTVRIFIPRRFPLQFTTLISQS